MAQQGSYLKSLCHSPSELTNRVRSKGALCAAILQVVKAQKMGDLSIRMEIGTITTIRSQRSCSIGSQLVCIQQVAKVSVEKGLKYIQRLHSQYPLPTCSTSQLPSQQRIFNLCPPVDSSKLKEITIGFNAVNPWKILYMSKLDLRDLIY